MATLSTISVWFLRTGRPDAGVVTRTAALSAGRITVVVPETLVLTNRCVTVSYRLDGFAPTTTLLFLALPMALMNFSRTHASDLR